MRESIRISHINSKVMTTIKGFGISTIILGNVFAILLILLHHFNKAQSPVLLLWDKVNKPNWTGMWAFVLYLSGIALLLLVITYRGFLYGILKKSFAFTYITIVDKVLAGVLIGLMLYRVITTYWLEKLDFIVDYYILFGIILIYIIGRMIKITKTNGREQRAQKFVGDTPAIEDLLSRKNVVESLSSAIKDVHVKGSFVIGMYGEWGEGKTTVLDMVEQKLKEDDSYIHVIRFEPWYFNSMNAIIKNYFDLICESLGKKLMTPDLVMLISDYRDLLLDSIKGFKINKIIEMVIPDFTSRQSVNTIKKKIEGKLEKLNQKVVIFIDDLDRMEREEILLVFKMVKLFSDFDNFIYILSFDKRRIERILRREMLADKDYLDKIIQVGFTLPKVPNETFDNILINYLNTFIKEENLIIDGETKDKIQRILHSISVSFDDVRKIKRFHNLLSVKFAMLKTKVNFYDFFIITFIEFSFPIQYKEILRNKNKFVYYLSDTVYRLLHRNIDAERKKYYDEFFSKVTDEEKRRILKEATSSIFTSVSHYKDGYHNLISNNVINTETIQKRPIEDSHFFDTYFTFEKNEYMLLNEDIEEFLLTLNYGIDDNEKNAKFVAVFSELSLEKQVQFFKTIKGYIKDIDANFYSIFTKIIYKNSPMYDDKDSEFMDFTVYMHAVGIVVNVIRIAPTNELKESLLEDIVKHCIDLEFVREVLHFAETDAGQNAQYEDVFNKCVDLFKKKIQKKYIAYGVNIFNGNQRNHGMWVLINYVDNKQDVTKYYYSLIEKELSNIIKFLSIFQGIVISHQDGKSRKKIRFNNEDFNKYFDKETINNYIRSYEESNNGIISEDEQKLITLFKEFYKGNTGVHLSR